MTHNTTAAELEKLLAETTQGPWVPSFSDTHSGRRAVFADAGLAGCAQVCILSGEFIADEANARLIAMSPTLARKVIAAEKLAEVGVSSHSAPPLAGCDSSLTEVARVASWLVRQDFAEQDGTGFAPVNWNPIHIVRAPQVNLSRLSVFLHDAEGDDGMLSATHPAKTPRLSPVRSIKERDLHLSFRMHRAFPAIPTVPETVVVVAHITLHNRPYSSGPVRMILLGSTAPAKPPQAPSEP